MGNAKSKVDSSYNAVDNLVITGYKEVLNSCFLGIGKEPGFDSTCVPTHIS